MRHNALLREVEEVNASEHNGRRDGERAEKLHEEADDAAHADEDLNERRQQEGSLQLKQTTFNQSMHSRK